MFSQPNSTDAESIIKAYENKEILVQSSRVKNIEFRNIGPTIMSGRVVALEVNPQDPTKFYVAYITLKSPGVSDISIIPLTSFTYNVLFQFFPPSFVTYTPLLIFFEYKCPVTPITT